MFLSAAYSTSLLDLLRAACFVTVALISATSTVLANGDFVSNDKSLLNFYKNSFGNSQASVASGPSSVSITNLTTLAGKTIYLNCSLGNFNSNSRVRPVVRNNEVDLSGADGGEDSDNKFFAKLNPTWLKADPIYSQFGLVTGYRTENIVVTRKGMIADSYKSKLKLIKNEQSRMLVLRISDVDIRDEGKYICREFNSQLDKLFYLNVYCKWCYF
jgi:hypothetical protein